MAEPVSVDAGWAIRSKEPGTRADYAVLAASTGPLSEREFASVLTHFAVGTPPAERDRPGSLPWVIISRVGVDQQIYLGLAIQGATGAVDGVGRQIASTTYFCVPYAGLERTPVSYSDLYEHLDQRREELPYPGRGPIPLRLPPFSPGRVAGDLDRGRFGGEQAVVSATALLLSGPVSVTGAEGAPLAERLGFLDAVATLLPYGFRTAFTGATWSDSATRHPIRLAFAARPRPEAAAVRWGTVAAAPASGPGAEFHDTFQRIRAHRPGPEDLEALIAFLASGARMAPCDFDHPQAAIAAVRDFGLPFLVWDEVLEHHASCADIRTVITTGRIGELPAEGQQDLLTALVRRAAQEPQQNWPVLREWAPRITAVQPGSLLPALVGACRELLWGGAARTAFGEHAAMAADLGVADPFLAGVIADPDPGPALSAGRAAAAELVSEYVLDAGDPAAFPETGRVLARTPAVASDLVAHAAGAGGGHPSALRAVLAWLEPAPGRLTAPFRAVLDGDPGGISPDAVRYLAGQDGGYVTALLAAADQERRLGLVLPGFTIWLGDLLRRGGAAAQESAGYWAKRLRPLSPAEPAASAWLDLTLLLTGDESGPRFLLSQRGEKDRRQYVTAIMDGWRMLADDASRDMIVGGLVRYLRREHWSSDATSAATVTSLGRRLTEDGRRPELREIIEDWLESEPAAGDRPSARERRPRADVSAPAAARGDHRPPASSGGRHGQPLAAEAPPVRRDGGRLRPDDGGTLAELRGLHSGASAVQVAEVCARAFRESLSLEDVIGALMESGAIHSGGRAADMLKEIHRVLEAPAGKQGAVEDWLTELTLQFATGEFDPAIAADFRAQAVRAAAADIDYQTRLLQLVVPEAYGDRQDWEARIGRSLNRAIESLEGLAHASQGPQESRGQRSHRFPALRRRGGSGEGPR